MPAILLFVIIYQLFFALPAYIKKHAKPYCEQHFEGYPDLLSECKEQHRNDE